MKMKMEKLSEMYFEKNKESIKKNSIIYTFVIVGTLILCGICEIEFFYRVNDFQAKKISYESMTIDEQINYEIESNEEVSNYFESENTLNEILVNIHKEYIYRQWFLRDEFGIPNNYANDRIRPETKDLEEVFFYKDNEGTIYFIPISMANKTIYQGNKQIQLCEHHDGEQVNLYLYSYKEDKPKLERAIYPVPDMKVNIYPKEVQNLLNDLHFLGVGKVPFPDDIPEGAVKLYENEYTDAAIEIIHSLFWEMKKYGEYQVYFGDYIYDSKIKHGYKFFIEVAIVGEDISYWWVFRAKDRLSDEGQVILDSCGGTNHSFPAEYDKDNYNYYAPWIDGIIHANRLVIPLTITEADEVKELGSFKDEDDLNTIHFYLK